MSEQSTGRGEWTRSGAFEVAPGVHRVPLPLPNDGLRAVNVYVLADPESGGLVLVDSGWSIPEARSLLVEALDSLGHALPDVRRFLVTHVHRDHYTQAVALRREFGTAVALGAGELGTLEVTMNPERMPLQQQLESLRAMGAVELADFLDKEIAGHERPAHRSDWELPDEWLVAGDVDAGGRTLTVVPTPGHTRGHVVFHDLGNGLLFAGDHVLPTITPSIGFEPVLSPNPLGDFLASLALVRTRPDARLLPAHGPVTDSVHARIDELIAHHGNRLDETERAVAAGATTAYDVARQLRWTRRLRTLDELDPFNQMLAIAETGAHLQLLAAQSRVSVTDDSNVRHYTVI